MSKKLIKLISTFFYVGQFPFAPGTVASAVGVLIYLVFGHFTLLYLLLTAGVVYFGFKTSGEMEKVMNKKDPGCVVIDEVAGMMIALYFMPMRISVLIVAFFLFRAFDMFKIYPCNKLEDLGGARGIMMDDIVAGLYTNIVMQFAIRWAGII